MRTALTRRGLVAGTAAALAVAGIVAFSGQTNAVADANQTTTVSSGPSSFTQQVPAGQPSQYSSQLERCANGVNHPVTGTNPILAEPLTTSFTSNVPLSVSASFSGNQWYGDWNLLFTNTSSQVLSVDCALIIFRAPSGSDSHSYSNQSPFGHPQEDYLEVPRGDGTSFYIVRLGFHDVPYAQRQVAAGQTFTYEFSGVPATGITLDQIRDSIRFAADLDLTSNQAAILHYGTDRLTN